MDIYIYLLILLICLLQLIKVNKKFIILPFMVITFFGGFRENVGIDYETYTLLFDWGADGTQVTSEPLFSCFLKFCYELGGNAQFFFLLSAILTNTFVYLFIRKVSTNYILSFLLYFCIVSFYLYTFNATRQWLACSVFLYSLTFFKDNKYFIYTLLNVLAGLFFHTSLFFIFPLTFIALYNISNRIRFFGYIAAIILGFISQIILANTMYEGYQEIDFEATIDMKVYVFMLISFLVEINKNKFIDKDDRWSVILINLNYLSILLLLMLVLQNSGTMILLFKRLHNYYFAIYIVMIPFLISKWKNLKGGQEVINLNFYIFLPLLFLVTVYFNGEFNKLIPYNYNFNIFR